jgi:HlyD family secretion protein
LSAVPYKSTLVILALAVALGFGIWRWQQGPQVEGYVVEKQPLVQTVVATGRIMNASRTQVGSEITGVVREQLVQEGDRVKPGDTLLVLRPDEIAAQVREAEAALAQLENSLRPQALVALERAESELAQARRETERRRALAQRSVLSAESLEQVEQAQTLARNAYEAARLKAAALAPGNVEETLLKERLAALKARLDKTRVRSEVAGTVLTEDVAPGDLVQPGQVLFTIVPDGATEIHVQLDERNLSLLGLWQEAMAVADAYPQRPFPARVSFIAPSIDPQAGTVEVRLVVEPVPDFLRQDMTVSVNIETGRRDQALAVPNDAIDEGRAGQTRVWVVRDGALHRQPVSLGLRGLAMSEVVDGLSAGDRILASPGESLEEGARVRFVPRPSPASGSEGNSASRNEMPVKFN